MKVDAEVARIDLIDWSDQLDAIVSVHVGGVQLLGLEFYGPNVCELTLGNYGEINWSGQGVVVLTDEKLGQLDSLVLAAYEEAKGKNDPPLTVEFRQPAPGELIWPSDGGEHKLVGMAKVMCGGRDLPCEVPVFRDRDGLEFADNGCLPSRSLEEMVHIEVAVRYAARYAIPPSPKASPPPKWSVIKGGKAA